LKRKKVSGSFLCNVAMSFALHKSTFSQIQKAGQTPGLSLTRPDPAKAVDPVTGWPVTAILCWRHCKRVML